ncbi:MAG: hypothetical protein P8Y95_01800 [Gammaproteobacteria bacterium]
MTTDIEAAALEAYGRFFTNFNTRDATTFAAALHFPHVRVSPRRAPVIIDDAETHAARQSWQPFIETGWDHTTGTPGEVLHAGPDKVHVLGGWTRYTKDEQPILSNTVAYIVTNVGGRWGIQSRFGIDQGTDAGDETQASAIEAVEAFVNAYNARNWVACAEHMNYPTLQIDPGRVGQWTSADEFAEALARGEPSPAAAHET